MVQSLPVRTVISRVNADLTENLSLKTLTGELNVNTSHLSTLFHKETGMSLTEYVNLQLHTFVNAYGPTRAHIRAAIEKICGKSEFKGTAGETVFCDRRDTRL